MTKEQFERWRDFALRMAKTCYSGKLRLPSRKWIIERVTEFLDDMEAYYPRIKDWDSRWTDAGPREYPCVSDSMIEFEWNRMPWSVRRLDDGGENADAFTEARDRWFGPVNCCVRAGLDMASAPSAGVVGFTLGDLRKMYHEGIPEWIAEGFRDNRGKPYTGKRLARLSDREGVWL